MFLTKKRADLEKQIAVEKALAGVPDLLPDVLALRDQVDTLKADLAQLKADQQERETEVAHTVEARLLAERKRQDAGVQELLLQVHAVQGDVAGILSAPTAVHTASAPDPRVDALEHHVKGLETLASDNLRAVTGHIGELNDTVDYLLSAPATVVTMVQSERMGIQSILNQHQMVRPMGGQ